MHSEDRLLSFDLLFSSGIFYSVLGICIVLGKDMGSVGSLLSGFGTVALVAVAYIQLKQWRIQRGYDRKIDLAMDILRKLFEFETEYEQSMARWQTVAPIGGSLPIDVQPLVIRRRHLEQLRAVAELVYPPEVDAKLEVVLRAAGALTGTVAELRNPVGSNERVSNALTEYADEVESFKDLIATILKN